MVIEVIGNTQEVFNYALNQNAVSVDKVIITQKEFTEQVCNPETIQALLTGLSQLTTPIQYQKLLENPQIQEALQEPINPSILKNFTAKIQEFFSSFDQVELKNYSFMNSMNSDTYSITLLSQGGCSYCVENIEKHQIQQGLSEVFSSYLYSLSTKLSLEELHFQIEFTRFEDMKKHFYLHKEGQQLLLFSTLSHPQLINGCKYHIKGEQYSSHGDQLFYFESSQDMKYERLGVKMGFDPIQFSGKILDEQELVAIHQATNNLNDVCVEGYITQKNKVELLSIGINSQSIHQTYEHNLLLYKSSQNYEDISLLPIHEITTQTPNPKYLLIRNIGEYKTCIDTISFDEIDGLIISFPLYSKQLLQLCKASNIDCIISKHQYDKVLQTKINWETLEVEAKQHQAHNPFSSLLPQKSQEDIEKSQKLKDVQNELNATIQPRMQNQNPTHTTQRPMTTSQKAQDTIQTHSAYANQSNERKGALAMLADSVIDNLNNESTPQEVAPQPPVVEQQSQVNTTQAAEPSFDMFSNSNSSPIQEEPIRSQPPQFSQTQTPSNNNSQVRDLLQQLAEIKKREEEILQEISRLTQ